MTTLTKYEHPAVAALREMWSNVPLGDGDMDILRRAEDALAASAAHDEAFGECVAALRLVATHFSGTDAPIGMTAHAALAKIASLGER